MDIKDRIMLFMSGPICPKPGDPRRDASDRIETLEAALRDLLKWYPDGAIYQPDLMADIKAAKTALSP